MCGLFKKASDMLGHMLVPVLDSAVVCPVLSGLIRGCLQKFLEGGGGGFFSECIYGADDDVCVSGSIFYLFF